MAAKKKTAKKSKTAKATSKKRSRKRAGGRPTAGQATNADFIRSKLAEGASAGDIVKAAAAKRMKISPPQVYKLKSKMAGGSKKPNPKVSASASPKAGKPTARETVVELERKWNDLLA